jgi:uncharacterized cupin superfamily protein
MASFESVDLESVELVDAPINPDWIVAGAPVARSSEWVRSSDGLTTMAVWSCTAGTFRWTFGCDELVHIIEGEVIVTDDDGNRVRLGRNSAALFAAGSQTTWEIPAFVRKHAILRSPVPAPVRTMWRILAVIKRIVLRKEPARDGLLSR